MSYSWRFPMLLGLLLIIVVIGAIFQRMGLGEIALIVGFFVLVFALQAGRYIVRQFIKGYNNDQSNHE